MDIKTAKHVCLALPSNISVLIRGEHGIGKSETVHQLKDALTAVNGIEYTLIDRRMSQMTEGDVIGLPKMDDEVTRFLPAEFIKTACDKPCILFLDEINRATQEVMQACFQLCLDRELNGNRLHPETRVFAAVNASAKYQVNEMDPAFLDRFFVIDLKPSAEDWFEWAEGPGEIHADMLAFLKERTTRLEPSDVNPGTVQPSRRSWARLDRTYRANKVYDAEMDKDTAARGRAYSLAIGFVGLEASSEFGDFLARRESRFNALDVMDSYAKNQAKIKKLGQDKLNGLIDTIVEHCKTNQVTTAQADNLGSFVKDLPGELRVAFITTYTKGTRPTPLFTVNFKTINPAVVPHIVAVFNDKASADAIVAKANEKAKKAK